MLPLESPRPSVGWANLTGQLKLDNPHAADFLRRETCRLLRRESRRMQLHELIRGSLALGRGSGDALVEEDSGAPVADLVQDAQLRFWARITRQEVPSPRGLLSKIVHDLLVDWIRSQTRVDPTAQGRVESLPHGSRRVRLQSLPLEHLDEARVPGSVSEPLAASTASERVEIALTISRSPDLDEIERAVLYLMYCADQGHQSVAVELGLSTRDVKCARDRGIRKLRRAIAA